MVKAFNITSLCLEDGEVSLSPKFVTFYKWELKLSEKC